MRLLRYDVIVIGGGNAALCAGLAARRVGARVLVLERAPRGWRGGNSKYTRNLRVANDGDGETPGTYGSDRFFEDLKRVSEDEAFNEDLARKMIDGSRSAPGWMESLGVRWQPPLRGTLGLTGTNRFFLGGGKALMNHYYETARRMNVGIAYETEAVDFEVHAGHCAAVVIRCRGETERIEAPAFVLASGGFESDRDWLAETWGAGVANFSIRGCRFNDGGPIMALLNAGARAEGAKGFFHGAAVDRRSPDYDGGIATRVDAIPLGIVVNRAGRRFYDEGEDIWPKRYAIWGRLIAEQPGQIAYAIFDLGARGQFIPPLFPPYAAPSMAELADQLGLDAVAVTQTVAEYNAAVVQDDGSAPDLASPDGRRTTHLSPPKSNWARPISRPPFYCYPLCPGVTFTYYGVAIDDKARVQCVDGKTFDNVFAAGEAMAGNILRRGYLAGVGMTIGTVFGRLAGEEAAARAGRR